MDDLISRQAAIDAICKACANGDDYVKCVERRPESTFCDEIVALRKLPSAQPEQAIAKWQKDFREYINMLNIPRDDYNGIMEYINDLPSAEPENTAPKTFKEQMNLECEFCRCHECGDTLYESSDWDGGISFDYIRDIKYCPICGRMLLDD